MSQYTIPSVVEKTVRGERAVDIYSRLLTDRIVYIGTEIDDGVANVVIAQLLHLESDSPDSPISLYLNSPGGSVTATLAIYDTMQFIRPAGGYDVRRPGGLLGRLLLAAGAAGQRTGAAARPGRCCTSRRAAARARCRTWPCRPRRSSACAPRWRRSCPGTPGRTVERLRDDTDRDLILSAQQAVDVRARGHRARQPEGGCRSRRYARARADPWAGSGCAPRAW